MGCPEFPQIATSQLVPPARLIGRRSFRGMQRELPVAFTEQKRAITAELERAISVRELRAKETRLGKNASGLRRASFVSVERKCWKLRQKEVRCLRGGCSSEVLSGDCASMNADGELKLCCDSCCPLGRN